MYYDKRTETEPVIQPAQLEPYRQGLLDAADYIRGHGWCQGRLENTRGMVCIVGALNKVIDSVDARNRAGIALTKALSYDPVKFNDTPGRTQEEVIALMEAVAKA